MTPTLSQASPQQSPHFAFPGQQFYSNPYYPNSSYYSSPVVGQMQAAQYYSPYQQSPQTPSATNLINLQGTYNNGVYQQAQVHYQTNFVQQPAQQSQLQQSNVSLNPVKTEPTESDQIMNSPYFTNPIPFKQEPSEMSSDMSNLNEQVNTKAASDVAAADDDSNAISIVTHLLKDKQILNQLEKVAQSFRHPTGSIYQGTWNFSSSSS